jgi:hypothetical protein
MKFYYTGAANFLQSQENPLNSLGGFVSNSPLPNGGLAKLFGSISQKSMSEGSVEYRAIVLRNETGSTQTVNLHYDNISNQPISSLKMALVSLATDDCGGQYMETISSGFSKPVIGTFTDNRSQSNALTFAIPQNGYIGVWVQRSVSQFQGSQLLSCESLIANFDTVSKQQSFSIELQDADVQGKYFTFGTSESSIFVWYDDGTSTTPTIPSREGIKVSIIPGELLLDVVTKTFDTLKSILEPRGEVTITKDGNTIEITQTRAGSVEIPNTATAPVVIITTSGSASTQETIEELEISIDY